ncbi:hypothetical protein ACFL5F_02235 [Planctomycetota bacterium]
MKYLGKDMTGLVANWKMDKSEGTVAYDSAGTNEGAEAGNILNPAECPFSTLALVKGGVPGQIIISQPMGMDWSKGFNWLLTRPEGYLMSEFKCFGENLVLGFDILTSVLLNDGQWNHVDLI